MKLNGGIRMRWLSGFVFPTLFLAVFAFALAGCGGGGGGGGGGEQQTPQTLVAVSGTAQVPQGSILAPVRAGIRPLAAGTAIGFPNASIKAIDYATGLVYAIPHDPPKSDNVTDGSGNFTVELPKGKDFILTFEKVLSSGKTARLGAVVPNAYEGQVVIVDVETSLVAAAVSPTINGTKKDLTQAYLDNVLALVNQVDPGLLLSLTLNNFTLGDPATFIGSNVQQGLVPPPGNNNIKAIHDNVITLIAGLPNPPGVPTLSSSAGDQQVVLSWPAVSTATSYNLYFRNDNTVNHFNGTLISNTTSLSYTHGSLTNDVAHYYVLTAVNAGGESAESGLVSAIPRPPIPGVPTNIGVAPGNGRVTVSWNPVAVTASYNIYWGTSAGVTKSSPNKITGVTSPYDHIGRTNGTTYYYIVTAVNTGGESGASAEASATPVVPPFVPVLADAKAMIADLRDTAQSLVNYRNRGVTDNNGIFDNAVANLNTQIGSVVVPYFQSFGTSLGSFLQPSFQAVGEFPGGGDLVWNSNGTLTGTSRSDGKWNINTFDGLNIALTAAGGSFPVTLFNFDVTSTVDTTLRFQGTFSNVHVTSVTVGGNIYDIVDSATIDASFANGTTGGSPGERLNVTGSLNITINATTGTITAVTLSGNFDSPTLKGSATLAVIGSIASSVYTGNDNVFAAQISRIDLSNATLNVVGKGAFSGNFRIDLVPAYLTQEEFSVTDNTIYHFITGLTLHWDERGGGKKLVDLTVGWWSCGWGGGFCGGTRWIDMPPTGSVNSWSIVLHRGTPNYSTYTFTVNRSNPAAPTISGTADNRENGINSQVSFTGTSLGKVAFFAYPSSATFSGTYTNADTSVPLDNLTGTLTAAYRNAASSNPFFVNRYEEFTATNFPQVNVRFDGEIRTRNRPAIVETLDATNSYSAIGATGNPDPGYAYLKISGTTNYQDGIESINGTATVFTRLVADPEDSKKREFKFEKAVLNLKNAKNVSFDLKWIEGFPLDGSLYYHPPTGSDTVFGNVAYVSALPIIRWSDSTFESIP